MAKEHNIKAFPAQAELGQPDSGKKLVDATIQHLGQGGKVQIDVIVNNAGMAASKPLQDIDVKHYEELYRVNVLGPILLVQAALPYLPYDRSGRIINVSSVSATVGLAGQSIYGGTKAALEAMTRTWSRELKGRATVNAVNPGPVDTPMWTAAIESEAFVKAVRPLFELTPLSQGDGSNWSAEEEKVYSAAGGRPAQPAEIAGVIGMLTSPESGWCTGSTICANGGMTFTN